MAADDEPLTDEELAAMIAEAEAIEAKPKPQYRYRYSRGGRSRADAELLVEASVDLVAARAVLDEMRDAERKAKIFLYERIAAYAKRGVSISFIAKQTGLNHRASVRRAIADLPKLHEQERQAQLELARVRRLTELD